MIGPEPASPFKSPTKSSGRKVNLSRSEFYRHDIPPVESESYSKSCQTDYLPELDPDSKEKEDVVPSTDATSKAQEDKKSSEESKAADQEPVAEDEVKIPELSPDQIKDILGSSEMLEFVERSAKVMEKVFYEKYDVLKDYTASGSGSGENNNLEGGVVVKSRDLFDERWCRDRAVTSMNWSPQHPELLATGYSNNTDPSDPDGVLLVWNMHAPRPEFTFHCQVSFIPQLYTGRNYEHALTQKRP